MYATKKALNIYGSVPLLLNRNIFDIVDGTVLTRSTVDGFYKGKELD